MYGQMTAGSWIYIGTPGHPAGHLRVLRRDRAPPLRRLARRDDHADRRPRRHGRRPAAGGDDERRRGAVRRGRPGAHRAAPRDALPRRGAPTTSTTPSPAAARQGASAAALSVGLLRQRRRGAARAAAPRASRPTSSPTRRARTTRSTATCPTGLTLEAGRRAARRRPRRVRAARRARAMAAHCAAMVGFLDARRRGLRLRQQPARRGTPGRLRARVRLPGLRPRLHPPAVLRGQGAVPLGGAVRRPGRHRRHRPRGARRVRRRRAAGPLDPRWPASGSPSRGCRRASAGWATASATALGLRFNEMVRRGELRGPDRDRARPPRRGLGRLALPRDRGDGRRLRRDRRLAAAQRARQHRGGRVLGQHPPRRRRRHRPLDPRRAWSASPTAPTWPPRSSSACSIADPGMGVMRHADAGYERAIEVAEQRGVRIPMREGG